MNALYHGDPSLKAASLIVQNSTDALILANTIGDILFVNAAFADLFHCDAYLMTDAQLYDLVALEDADVLSYALARLQQDGVQEFELTALRCDGTQFDAAFSFSTTPVDEEETRWVVVSVRDVSERKAADLALRRSEAFTRTILQSLETPIAVFDVCGRMVACNDAWRRCGQRHRGSSLYALLNDPHQLMGRSARLIDESWGAVRAGIRAVMMGQSQQFVHEYSLVENDQQTWHVLRVTPFLDSEPGIVMTCEDVTSYRAAEDALRRSLEQEREMHELKSRFLSIVSHEYRNPLTIIKSSTDLIKRYRDRMSDYELDDSLDRIHHQVSHLTTLIDDMLIALKAQVGKLTWNPVLIDVAHLVESIVKDVRLTLSELHQINFEAWGGMSVTACDPRLVRLAVDNLLSNAIKYSPRGGIIECLVIADDEAVHIIVRDRGIGIPQRDQERLFREFYRASNVGTLPGNGIGLALVKQIMDVHGGTITIESAEGHGTTVTLALPWDTRSVV